MQPVRAVGEMVMLAQPRAKAVPVCRRESLGPEHSHG